MDKQTTHLHTNRSQHCNSSQIYKHTTHSQIQQFSISTFKTSEKHFIKRHYIPQQIFHHLLIHQSQKFAKHLSSYKILMFNFYSLYLCLPHCLSPSLSLSVCLSLSLWCHGRYDPQQLMMPVSASDSLLHPKFFFVCRFLCFPLVNVGTRVFVCL